MSLQPNSVVQGDLTELLPQLKPGSVDLVFADPPFNIGYRYDVYEDERDSDDYLSWCHEWIEQIYNALKPDGTFWLAIGDEYAAELKVEAKKIGFHCRSWVIWYYTFGVNCVNGFSRSHTHLFHFVKNPKKFTFNRANPQIRVKSARQLVYADNRANPDGRLPDNTWIIRPQDAPSSFSPMHDTWYFARVAGTFKEREGFHGCQMPEQLLARIIRASSKPQDLVLDPFGGSGTTLSVAKKLGRRFLGFELSEEYVKYIEQRLEKTSVDDEIDGPEDPIESAPPSSQGKRKKKKKSDPAEEQALVDSYLAASRGLPVDFLLCDPELNVAFVDECKKSGLKGKPDFWNRQLLRLRKAAKLPRSTEKPPPFSNSQMDRVSYASEIAWRLLAIDFRKTLDELLCSPEFATEFDRLAIEFGPTGQDFKPVDFRRAAISIRKRSRKARQVAKESFDSWIAANGSYPITFKESDFESPSLEQSGVYVLRSAADGTYVGETTNLKERLNSIFGNPNWKKLKIDSVDFIPHQGSLPQLAGLQSAIAQRERPHLNCRLLMFDSELGIRSKELPA